MKKKIIHICIIMICVLSMVSCSNRDDESDSTIKDVITINEDIRTEYSRHIANELNDNSKMGLELLSDMSDKEYTKIEEEDGDDVYYIESTNEFVVVSKDGYLRTYFYPSDGLDYFNRQ